MFYDVNNVFLIILVCSFKFACRAFLVDVTRFNNRILESSYCKRLNGFDIYSQTRKHCQYQEASFEDTPLKQLCLRFNCDEVDPEDVSELLFELGVLSVSVEVESEKSYVLNDEQNWRELGKQRSWATALLRANFPASFNSVILEKILQETFSNVKLEPEVENLKEIDWLTKVQLEWSPQVINDLTIRFPWHIDAPMETPHQLLLEGGAAFGTGDHPTTRLCCGWLKRYACEKSVLDYGCGSAVLSLASLLYGANRAVGTDIDHDSLVSAAHNCDANDLHVELYLVDEPDEDGRYTNQLRGTASSLYFDPVSAIDGQTFDLIVANILAPILIQLAPELEKRLESGGRIALSGVVEQQAYQVVDAYKKLFQDVKVEEEEDGWVLITGIKR